VSLILDGGSIFVLVININGTKNSVKNKWDQNTREYLIKKNLNALPKKKNLNEASIQFLNCACI
jgi:hypothetical protein